MVPKPRAAARRAIARTTALKQRETASQALADKMREGGDRDPKGNSLWLLPSGPDQIGETFARDLHPQYRDFRWWMQAPGG